MIFKKEEEEEEKEEEKEEHRLLAWQSNPAGCLTQHQLILPALHPITALPPDHRRQLTIFPTW